MSGSAIILAGGKSTRLGRDKASEVLLGRTLLQRAVDSFEGLVDEFDVRHIVFAGDDLGDVPAFDAVDRLRGRG